MSETGKVPPYSSSPATADTTLAPAHIVTVQREWVLRYKWGNHPAATGLVMASTQERAEAVGRAWCLQKGAGHMQQIRFICVEDPILADESILA